MSESHPRLRKLDRIVMERSEGTLVVLHDPLGVSEPIAVDQEFLPVLDLLVGERSIHQIRQSLMMRGGDLQVEVEELAAFISDLSESGLLEDENFRKRWAKVHAAFLASPTLPVNAADILYPAKAEQFAGLFAADIPRTSAGSTLRGLWMPCEPIDRTAPLLDDLIRELPPANELDLIVLLAADGQQGLMPYAMTAKSYETPFGPTKGDEAFIAGLERELAWIRREEIRHRRNDGLELAATLAKWVYREKCPALLPISCGPSSLDAKNEETEAFFDAIELALMRKRVLFIACASLSHCGPAYGEGEHDGETQRDNDAACIDAFLRRAPRTFLRRVLQSPEQRARGAAPAYALSRLLDPDDDADLTFYQVLEPPMPTEEATKASAGGIGCAGVRVSAQA